MGILWLFSNSNHYLYWFYRFCAPALAPVVVKTGFLKIDLLARREFPLKDIGEVTDPRLLGNGGIMTWAELMKHCDVQQWPASTFEGDDTYLESIGLRVHHV